MNEDAGPSCAHQGGGLIKAAKAMVWKECEDKRIRGSTRRWCEIGIMTLSCASTSLLL